MKHRVLALTGAVIGVCALVALAVQTNAQSGNAARSSTAGTDDGSEDTLGASGSAGGVDQR